MGAAEASERLGVSRDSLVRMAAKGEITKVTKMPGKSGAWLFDREEIEQLAIKRCNNCPAPATCSEFGNCTEEAS